MKFSLRTLTTAIAVTAIVSLPCPSLLSGSEILYSYRTSDGERGGIALVHIDEETGAIGSHITICEDGRLAMAKKVRFNGNAQRIAVTNEGEAAPFVFLSKTSPPSLTGPAEVDTLCDEIRPFEKSFLASCDKGLVVLFKGKDGSKEKTFKARKKLSPPGNRPEDVVILKKKDLAVISFQKDNSSGTRFGNRLVVLSLPDLKLKGDVLIPRDHPELHVEGNPKLSGPGPEVLLVSEETNTVLTTLDFYGAVGMSDLDGILKGKLTNYEALSLSPDGKWGTAFPDRVCSLNVNGHHYALITNAGIKGGTNLIDLKERRIIHTFKTPSGLEAPQYLPSCMVAVSVCSGKTKYRKGNKIVKEFNPNKMFYIFDFTGVDAGATSFSSNYIKVEGKALIAVAPETSPFVLVASKNQLLVIDASDGSIVNKAYSIGIPQRFELKP